MNRVRRAVIQRLMDSLFVVKGEILLEPRPRLANRPVFLEVNFLVFDAAPKPFDENVVEGPARPSMLKRTRAASNGAWN